MLLEGAFFIQSISNFMKRPDFLFVTKLSFSYLPPLGGIWRSKIKCSIMVRFQWEKKYVVQIYKIKLHTKNHVDGIKNKIPRED